MSLIAGLVFGGLSAYGAYNISNNPKNIQVSLRKHASMRLYRQAFKLVFFYFSFIYHVIFFQLLRESSQSWWDWDTRSLGNWCLQALLQGWGLDQNCIMKKILLMQSNRWETFCWISSFSYFIRLFSHSLLMVFRLLLLIVVWPRENWFILKGTQLPSLWL